jgi:ATP-binding cassette subfamily B protein
MKDKKTNKITKDKKSENYKNKTKDKKASEVKLSRVFYHYWKYARNYKWGYLVATILEGLGDGLFMVGMPYVSKHLINALNDNKSLEEVRVYFLLIIVLYIFSSVCRRISTYLAIKYDVDCINDLIKYSFRNMSGKDMLFFENTFVGGLVNKMQQFAVAYNTLSEGLRGDLFTTLIRISFSVGIIFFVDHRIGAVFMIWFIVYGIVTFLLLRKKMRLDYVKSISVSKRLSVTADVVGNMLNLKIFSARQKEIKYHGQVTDQSRMAVLKSWHWGNFSEVITSVQFLILEVVALGWALILWSKGELTVGDIVMIQGYFALFLSALWSVDKLFRRLVQAISDAKEMVEILDQEVEVQDIKGAKKLEVSQGEIVFQDTVFSYPNQKENVFNKFNLTIPAGQTVGLVGTSGAGKTTITKLLLRFIDLDSGKIKIDRQDIAKVTQDSLRNTIAYVPQEPVLFHRSIYENIAYAKPEATEKEVLKAAKKAHVEEFVQTLEQGYDTMVGERGVKLSGGQKQRVAIARAFLKNAPILVLDEATSALDSVSEELIQDALFKLMKDKTVIIVAHRLSTIQRIDRILVIEEGKIVEDGTHQELLQKKNGLYTDFWKKQTRIFE